MVEVWSLPGGNVLDPVRCLSAYCRRRTEKFGLAETMPLFIHEDGSNYTKVELNSDLESLLSIYPELQNPRDLIRGHSFRAGLSTILSLLGFSEEEIKSWGRWTSSAFLSYIKDQTHRKKVAEKLKNTFESIFNKK